MTPTSTYRKGTKSNFNVHAWIIALLVLFTSATAFAGDRSSPDFKGMESFRRAYPQATEISLEQRKDFTIVNFTWNGMKLQAFYDMQGNSLGTSREILVSNLPLSFMVNIKTQYPNYQVAEAIEFDRASEGLTYYVTIINPKKTYVLQISNEGNISVFKKMKH